MKFLDRITLLMMPIWVASFGLFMIGWIFQSDLAMKMFAGALFVFIAGFLVIAIGDAIKNWS